ncbi:MAG: NAD(P)/FAD-dependent oxidoreductase [Bacteroidia bacterium]
MIETDYLLIGQGISGSVLAHQLRAAGKRVLVMDSPSPTSCSRVAAGVYNPISFRRMNNTWRAEEIGPYAIDFYQQLEKQYNISFHDNIPIHKVLADASERRIWETTVPERPALFAEAIIRENPFPEQIAAPYGLGVVTAAGRIDSAAFLEQTRTILVHDGQLLEEDFDVNRLMLSDDFAVYDKRIRANYLVTCTGIRVLDEQYFSFVPFIPVRGQVLTLAIPDFKLDAILSRGIYLIPLADGNFLCGSNYDRDINNEDLSDAARTEILDRLKKFLIAPFTLLSERAGVRPTTRDRRPVLGAHPHYPRLVVFNGMGSKGAMLAPWCAEQLIQHLEQHVPLDKEIDIKRFLK